MNVSITKIIAACAAVIFILYVMSVSPSIAGGDSGELVAEGCILGTAHPPGYPLFTLITFALKKFGFAIFDPVANNVAYRLNILSCALTVGAAVCMGLMVQLALPKSSPPPSGNKGGAAAAEHPLMYAAGSVVAMGLFCFSPLIWQYAVTAEVFPLNTFFASLICYLVLLFAHTGKFQVAVVGAFVCGLALTNQHTIVLYEAPLILWMLWLLRHEWKDRPLSVLGVLALAFFVGLLPYIYIPLSSIMYPANKSASWGQVDNWSGFLHHFLRRDYGTLQLYSGDSGKNAEGFQRRTVAYFNDLTFTQGLYQVTQLFVLALISWRRLSFATGSSKAPATAIAIVGANKEVQAASSAKITDCAPTPGSSTPAESSGSLKKDKKNKNKSGKGGSGSGDDFDIDCLEPAGPAAGKKGGKNGSNASNITSNGDSSSNSTSTTSGSVWSTPASSTYTTISKSDCGVLASDANWTPYVLFLTQCFYFGIFHTLANLPLGDKLLFGVHQRFWMQPNVLMFMWAGVGFNEALRLIRRIVCGAGMTRALLPATYSEYFGEEPCSTVTASITISLAVVLVGIQYYRWHFLSDQTGALHFRNYAKAILDPLPKDALLLVNYDMQWTSLRYVTQCEGHRADVTLINLSMMTYSWFISKRPLYKNLKFPGTYLAAPNDKAVTTGTKEGKAFTLTQFLDANVMRGVPIFLGGKVSHQDPELTKRYDNVPSGLVSRFVPMHSAPNGTVFQSYVYQSWRHVLGSLQTLPDLEKYTEETWEWTIGRDFKDRVQDTAAFYLEAGIQVAKDDPVPLTNAVYWLEAAVVLETSHGGKAPSSLLKNAGLGHLHLVQSLLLKEKVPLVLDEDLFGIEDYVEWPTDKRVAGGMDWKAWSAERFLYYWGAFLERPDAKEDHQYKTIKDMHDKVAAVQNKINAQAQDKPTAFPSESQGSMPGPPKTKTRPAMKAQQRQKKKKKKQSDDEF